MDDVPGPRTDQAIVDQTNELARTFYTLMECQVPEGYRFDRAHHPQERLCWRMACEAQLLFTETDPEDALSDIG